MTNTTTFDMLNHLSDMIVMAEIEEKRLYAEFTSGKGTNEEHSHAISMIKWREAAAKRDALSDAWSELSRLNTRGIA